MADRPTTTPRAVAYGKQAMLDFIHDFHDAPDDADIEIRIGRSPVGGPPMVVVSLRGKDTAFEAYAAETMASIMEDAMRKFPNEAEARTLPNIIMGLRQGAATARKQGA